MKKTLRALYNNEYKSTPVEQHNEAEKDIFDTYMDELLPGRASNPYKEYSEGQRLLKKPDNIFKWWDNQTEYPELRQMAFDFLFILAMSPETERIFSQTKRTISDTRCRLGALVIEAIEC
jgi:membrane-anchored protein YejM (alkaline phosphatase superfamily)